MMFDPCTPVFRKRLLLYRRRTLCGVGLFTILYFTCAHSGDGVQGFNCPIRPILMVISLILYFSSGRIVVRYIEWSMFFNQFNIGVVQPVYLQTTTVSITNHYNSVYYDFSNEIAAVDYIDRSQI